MLTPRKILPANERPGLVVKYQAGEIPPSSKQSWGSFEDLTQEFPGRINPSCLGGGPLINPLNLEVIPGRMEWGNVTVGSMTETWTRIIVSIWGPGPS